MKSIFIKIYNDSMSETKGMSFFFDIPSENSGRYVDN